MKLTIEVDTERIEEVESVIRLLQSAIGYRKKSAEDGDRSLNYLLLECVSARTANTVRTFMANNKGVINGIEDLERVVQNGVFKRSAKGVGDFVIGELSDGIKKARAI